MAGIDDFENGMSDEELKALDKDDTPTANPENGDGEGTPTVPPTEEKTNEEKEDGEGSEPKKTPEEFKGTFHTHPRWIAREKKLKEYEERDRAREAELAELRGKLDIVSDSIASARQAQEDGEEVKIPEWFVTLYGEDEEAYLKYLEAEEARLADFEEKAIKRIETRRETAAREAEEREAADLKWVDDSLDALRTELQEDQLEDFDTMSKEDQESFTRDVLRIVRDYTPTDEDGNIDFRKAYNILQNEKAAEAAKADPKPKNSVQDRKRLAGRAPSANEPNTEEVASNETFARGDKPW